MDDVKLVPARMLLDKETIGAINFHCGDGGDNFGEHSDGLLWIGTVTDDDGKEVYGLHLATAEYPEEGSTTLVEFAEPLDAQRLRADTAEAELARLREKLADSEECYTAIAMRSEILAGSFNEQTDDLMRSNKLLKEAYAELIAIKNEIGFRGETISLIGRIDAELSAQPRAALNPKPECCKVSAEDQALLNAGEYTPEELFGVGGKPSCPKCFNPKPEAGSHE